MNLVLKDFQTEAVESLHQRLADARSRAADGKLEAITLSAPTGSGKTVILTRLIELALEGDEHHHPEPDAVFLWVTDQPELNIQTRDKMQTTSHLLTAANMVEITVDFDEEVFPSGRVFFLNTQKLSTGSSWVKTGDNRTFTLWDTIRNTVNARPGGFFVIIDEAHRGTKLDKGKTAEANSIMQRFLLGSEEIPPVPLIIGISATLDRFTDLLHAAAKAKKARIHQPVDIDPADVIASGLLKAKVILHHPEQALGTQYALLREAVRNWREMESRWAAYCASQHETQIVRPILLVQVEDGSKGRTSATDLDQVVSVLREEAGGLNVAELAHSFQEGTPVLLTDKTAIRYLAPSAIDADPFVKFVLFKTSLNTGWDCPRAEVMMSFRRAKDATYIAQLVGRMVRTPLARQIELDEVLNSVSLLLPNFDADEVDKVIRYLTDPGNDALPTVVENTRQRVVLNQATSMADAFAAVDGLPNYIVPRRKSGTEVQRLGQLADALSHSGLKLTAASEAREKLVDVLDAEYASRKSKPQYVAIVREDGTIPVLPDILDYGTAKHTSGEVRQVPVSGEMVAELYEWSRKRLGLDLGLRYWKRRVETDHDENHTLTKLAIYTLAADPEVLQLLEESAGALVTTLTNAFKQKIKKLPESERARFDDVKRQAGKPALTELDFCNRLTLDWSVPTAAAKWPKHLYQDSEGLLPDRLNKWETASLKEEMAREDFVGWLRNREKQPWALCIPYKQGGGWKGCYPDFLVFRKKDNSVVVDIIDPHLTSMEDSPLKAAALASFADEHQDSFGRIDLIVVDKAGMPDEQVKRLRLMDDKTRKKVMAVSSQQHLRDLFDYEG
jgi:type III restriction enzyme